MTLLLPLSSTKPTKSGKSHLWMLGSFGFQNSLHEEETTGRQAMSFSLEGGRSEQGGLVSNVTEC